MNPSVRMSAVRIFSAQSSELIEITPPMLPKASFFMLITAPSESANISRAISIGVFSA
jgi:hypothetical protein